MPDAPPFVVKTCSTGRVIDMKECPYSASVAKNRELALTHCLDNFSARRYRRAGTVKAAVAENDSRHVESSKNAGPKPKDGIQCLAHGFGRVRVERIQAACPRLQSLRPEKSSSWVSFRPFFLHRCRSYRVSFCPVRRREAPPIITTTIAEAPNAQIAQKVSTIATYSQGP